jgi:uncharacterized protein (DUF488 family)
VTTLFTIGFTRKSAETFFTLLQKAGVKKVLDTRLHNVSQLAGFAKRNDLEYFLKAIGGIEYSHCPELAPSEELLGSYKKEKLGWDSYEKKFRSLIKKRKIEKLFTPADLDGACLLCSEEKPHHCHRRLVAEYIQSVYPRIKIQHL